MIIETRRCLLRDFRETDWPAFREFQTDARYCRLYHFQVDDSERARALFDLFRGWQGEVPRTRFQWGAFSRQDAQLVGCAGIRGCGERPGTALVGLELAPDHWGRYRLAQEIAEALLWAGFDMLGFVALVGTSSSGNVRIAKLARLLGAEIAEKRPGPAWMAQQGFYEVDWAIARSDWEARGRNVPR